MEESLNKQQESLERDFRIIQSEKVALEAEHNGMKQEMVKLKLTHQEELDKMQQSFRSVQVRTGYGLWLVGCRL